MVDVSSRKLSKVYISLSIQLKKGYIIKVLDQANEDIFTHIHL